MKFWLKQLNKWLSNDETKQLIKNQLHGILTNIVDNVHSISDSMTRTYFDFNPEDHASEMIEIEKVNS